MSEKNQSYVRFNIPQRVEHIILILSFTTLAVTGLAQKYSSAGISEAIIGGLGGIELTRIIHRIAAIVFVLQSVYHFVIAGYKIFVRRLEASMVPGIKDAKDAIQAFRYNLGMAKDAPKMPRYNFMEKMEYWAMIWGLVLMGLTGFMLWNPIITARFLPGQFIPAAKVAHGLEALLAVLAIIIWHFYNVHIKAWNSSMFTGKMSRHHMEEEHGEELEKIESGKAVPAAVSTETLHKRQLIYWPIALILSAFLVFGIYWLATAETTALTTVPPVEEGVPVFSPVTPTPEPTEAAAPSDTTGGGQAAAATWNGGIGALFADKCGSCHGPSAMGGLAVDTYANTVKGGAGGPGIVPGDASASSIVTVQEKGGHPGQFSADELQQVIDWINAGAPES